VNEARKQHEPGSEQSCVCCLHNANFMLFSPNHDDGGYVFLQDVVLCPEN
jgi:hypothetical protein